MDLNRVSLIGNVVRDPEVRTTPSGQSVANITVATNLIWKDKDGKRQQKAEFHSIVAWRKLGEIVGSYVKKGGRVYVEGRLETRSWDDPNGVKRYKTEIIADNLILLDRPGAQQADMREPTGASEQPAAPTAPSSGPAEEEINIEDIPF